MKILVKAKLKNSSGHEVAPADTVYIDYETVDGQPSTKLNMNWFKDTNVKIVSNKAKGKGFRLEVNVKDGSEFASDISKGNNAIFGDYNANIKSLNFIGFGKLDFTNAYSMFSGYTKMTTLNLSNFDTSKVTDMSYMFFKCYALTTNSVLVSSKFDINKAVSDGKATREWFTTDRTTWTGNTQSDAPVQQSDTRTTTGGWTEVKKMYTKSFGKWRALGEKDIANADEVYIAGNGGQVSVLPLNRFSAGNINGFDIAKDFKPGITRRIIVATKNDINKFKIIAKGMVGISDPEDSFFTNSVSEVTLFEHGHLINNYRAFFYGISTLNKVSTIDTSESENFGQMFAECSNLTSIQGLNTVKGTKFDAMFYDCKKLTTVPNINTSLGTDFNRMFWNCSSLTKSPISTTPLGEDFEAMFYGCEKLTTVGNLKVSKSIKFTQMFQNCKTLTTIPALDTSKGELFDAMFVGNENLTTISAIDTSKATSTISMFIGCGKLTHPNKAEQTLIENTKGKYTWDGSVSKFVGIDGHTYINGVKQ